MTTVLELQDVCKSFGGLAAADAVSLSVEENAIHGLIGPNGAGKTTLFSLITGYYRADRGKIVYRGDDITGASVSARARAGLIRTFQSNILFFEESAFANVLMGGLSRAPRHSFDWFYRRPDLAELPMAEANAILDFIGLASRSQVAVRDLSHGQQRLLGIGVALAARPKLLLLDEPFTGMTGREKDGLMNIIKSMRAQETTIVLVEHDMRAVMRLCDRITVLNFGKVLAEGTPEFVRQHPDVISAYLGAH